MINKKYSKNMILGYNIKEYYTDENVANFITNEFQSLIKFIHSSLKGNHDDIFLDSSSIFDDLINYLIIFGQFPIENKNSTISKIIDEITFDILIKVLMILQENKYSSAFLNLKYLPYFNFSKVCKKKSDLYGIKSDYVKNLRINSSFNKSVKNFEDIDNIWDNLTYKYIEDNISSLKYYNQSSINENNPIKSTNICGINLFLIRYKQFLIYNNDIYEKMIKLLDNSSMDSSSVLSNNIKKFYNLCDDFFKNTITYFKFFKIKYGSLEFYLFYTQLFKEFNLPSLFELSHCILELPEYKNSMIDSKLKFNHKPKTIDIQYMDTNSYKNPKDRYSDTEYFINYLANIISFINSPTLNKILMTSFVSNISDKLFDLEELINHIASVIAMHLLKNNKNNFKGDCIDYLNKNYKNDFYFKKIVDIIYNSQKNNSNSSLDNCLFVNYKNLIFFILKNYYSIK